MKTIVKRIVSISLVVVSIVWMSSLASGQQLVSMQADPVEMQRLMKQLQSPLETERMQAAKELGRLGPAAKDALPALQQALRDPDIDVRQIAAAALARIQRGPIGASLPDLYMLSVGIDRYQAPVNNLSGCVNDAVGMATVFKAQAAKLYRNVDAQILTDSDATRAKIHGGLDALRAKGKAGDWYVIVLSGHGGPAMHRWAFLTHDRGDVTDETILGLADMLASDGKKVLVIIDACFAGQMRYAAHEVLNRYRDPNRGGIILAISSMPAQTSSALAKYSAFARAFEEGVAGMADYDQDQMITLKELKRFTYNRVYELCLQRRPYPGLPVASQDSVIDASLSIAESTPLAQGQKPTSRSVDDGPPRSMPELAGTWVSSANSTAGAPAYRLKLDSNGVFRATAMVGNRAAEVGQGVFKVTQNAVLLQHWQGIDRLEEVTVTGNELRFRYQGRGFTLYRDGPVVTAQGSVAGTTWTGTETLAGFGALTFEFEPDGKAVMIDAKSTVAGNWTQTGDRVTITFQNCVYNATIKGQNMTGNAQYTIGEGAWTFSLTRAPGAPGQR